MKAAILYRSFSFLLLVAMFTLTVHGATEQRDIYGINFAAGEITELDSQLLRVRLGENENIISRDNLENYIVQYNFADPEIKYLSADLAKMLQLAGAAGQYDLALLALHKLSQQIFEDYQLLPGYLQPLLEKQFFIYLYNNPGLIIPREGESSRFWQILYWELIKNSHANTQAERVFFEKLPFNTAIIAELIEKNCLWLINKQARPEDINQLLIRGLRISNTINIQQLKSFVGYFQELQAGKNQASALGRIIDNYPQFFQTVKPEIYRQIYLNSDQLIVGQNFREAADLVARVNFDDRTEQTHAILLKIISALPVEQAALLLLEPYQSMFRSYAEKDPAILAELQTRIKSVINEFLNKSDPLGAGDYIDLLQQYQPDSEAVRTLTLKQAELFRAKGMEAAADKAFQRVRAEISLWQNFKFRFQSLFWPVAGFLALLGIIVLVRRMINERAHKRRVAEIEAAETKAETTRENLQRNFLSPRYQRYTALLAFFELHREATLMDIKKTYRNRIKRFHPDINQSKGQEANDDFIEATSKYEELLALYEELHAPKGNK